MKEYPFGPIKVMEGAENGKPDAVIRVPSQVCTVEEAEAFMCDLIDAIAKAREIVKDPL